MSEKEESPADYGTDPQGVVRRWLMELELADKNEKAWRLQGKDILKRYRAEERKLNSFNILFSNTETLYSAVYTSPPKPDVRRRFKDNEDPIGKVASRMLERSLEFSIDTDDFATAIGYDVLDMLLPGRGVSRVRYVPKFAKSEESPDAEIQEGDTDEELAWEQAIIDHVDWEDFRHGPGRTWKEVDWVGFRHRMTRDELREKFGELANKITMDDLNDDAIKGDAKLEDTFKTAEVWEFWCKVKREVIFIAKSLKNQPLKTLEDPMRLVGFYPIPRPLKAIGDPNSTKPLALYEQYAEQARELDSISTRINKIIDAIKVRGIYDSTMSELSELLRGDDNELIPAQNVSAWIERGGIENAIWMMPIKDAASVLQVLYQQRDATKAVIYEITGIADIMRGATDPGETLGAQKMKAHFGGKRITRLQIEVQRYARDLLRLMAEIIGERFQANTLMAITGMTLPTDQEVQQAEQQYQMQMQQYQMMQQQMQQQGPQGGPPGPPPGQPQGGPPPGPPQGPPPPQQPQQPDATIDQVMALLKDDLQRSYRVDVETDSMVSAALNQDAQEIEQLVGSLTTMMHGLTEMMQSGALPIEAGKEMMMAVVRRAKMGTAVEDSLEKMKQPNPPPDPNAGKAQIEQAKMQMQAQSDQQKMQAQSQADQQKMQADQQLEQFKAQIAQQGKDQDAQREMQLEQQRSQLTAQLQAHEQQVQAEQNMHQNQLEAQRAQQQAQMDAALEQQRQAAEERIGQMEQSIALMIARMNAEAKIEVAETAANTTLQAAQISAAKSAEK